MSPPRISIVTSSYNHAAFIRDTIESVRAQNYPNVEHIVVDGMSTDDTAAILAEYPHLKVIREPDQGQADAVNKGFRAATGDILAFLNSDDTLLPGALHRVAAEIDAERGRHIVMGRCRFIATDGRYTGIEHPSGFESFHRVLAIWKGHLIPQPAVFWTREVWDKCGPMEESLVLDYDLFCRFASQYRFHWIDQPLATYRLHAESKTSRLTDQERLDNSIRVSRRYWGSPLRPAWWRLAISLWNFRLNRTGRARGWIAKASDAWRAGRRLTALRHLAATAVVAPEALFYVVVFPVFSHYLSRITSFFIRKLPAPKKIAPQTAAYLDRTDRWHDGWIGPRYVTQLQASGGECAVMISGATDIQRIGRGCEFSVSIDGEPAGKVKINAREFEFVIKLADPLRAGEHTVEVSANKFFVPYAFSQGDFRPLSWRTNQGGVNLVSPERADEPIRALTENA